MNADPMADYRSACTTMFESMMSLAELHPRFYWTIGAGLRSIVLQVESEYHSIERERTDVTNLEHASRVFKDAV